MKKFKVSDGPDFVTKAEDVAGLYRDLLEKAARAVDRWLRFRSATIPRT
jgi:hypothetical protein